MTIISESKIHESVAYTRDFQWRDSWNGKFFTSGFGFPCDAQGNIQTPKHEIGRENLRQCLTGEHDVVDLGVSKSEWTYREPAIGRCDCGREVLLDGFTCPCDCGRDYNSAGQLLAPREQWGEETGETLGEILAIR